MHASVRFVNRDFYLTEKSRPLPHPWPPEETFWDRLQRLRNAMGLDNAAVAKAAGVAIGTVSNWRQGRTPDTPAVLKLAQFFGVTVEWLLTGREEPEPKVGKSGSRAITSKDLKSSTKHQA